VVVGVGVGVVVAVAVGVGVGVVVVGVGVGDCVGAGAEAVFVCVGAGFAEVAAGADGVGAAAGPWPAVVGWLAVGAALAGTAAFPVGSAGALVVTALLEARTASRECGTCEPLSARTVMIPADVTAITMPAAAAIRASARARRLGGLTARGKPFGPNGPARRVTSCRYARVCWL
jgi:hypothetical protein